MQKARIRKAWTRKTRVSKTQRRETVRCRIGMAAKALAGTAPLVGSLLFLASVPLAAQSGPDVARAYREAHEVEILHDFAELLSYPNRAFTEDIVRAAEYIRGQLEEVGVDAELLRMEGASPIVYGELMVPGATRSS